MCWILWPHSNLRISHLQPFIGLEIICADIMTQLSCRMKAHTISAVSSIYFELYAVWQRDVLVVSTSASQSKRSWVWSTTLAEYVCSSCSIVAFRPMLSHIPIKIYGRFIEVEIGYRRCGAHGPHLAHEKSVLNKNKTATVVGHCNFLITLSKLSQI